MIVDDNNKFVFVAVPKTASTTIHLAFGYYKHPEPPLYHMKLNELLDQRPECSNYFKWCFVRNPYDRFLSTWFNPIDHRAGHTWAKDLLKYKTFENFCLNFTNSKWKTWIHFRPQTDYCIVDNVNKMDFIGKQENFDKDFTLVCNKIGIGRPATGRYRSTPHGTVNELMTDKMKDIVYNFYQRDFEMFGYEK